MYYTDVIIINPHAGKELLCMHTTDLAAIKQALKNNNYDQAMMLAGAWHDLVWD